MKKNNIKKLLFLLILNSTLLELKAQYTDLINFTAGGGSYNGVAPYGSLTLSGDTLYGMTWQGGIEYGNIFSVQTNGTNFIDLVDFTGAFSGSYNGENPYGSLTLSGDTLYGMTSEGGNGYGNIFSVHTNGTNYKDLVNFTGDSGSYIGNDPWGSLTLSGNILYGMTQYGGINGYGNIFSVQTNGTNFKDLVDFTGTSGSYIGEYPYLGSLTLSGGILYGMTSEGGIYGYGNIFSVQTNGTNFKDLVDFTGDSGSYNGYYPSGSLTLSGGILYGMTLDGGGIYGYGNIFSVQTNGTNFKDLVDFTGDSGSYNGYYPSGSLTLSGGILYGMTLDGGGIYGYGNIFSVQTNGTNYKDLVDFTGGSGSYNGYSPYGSLTLSGSILYGMTCNGGEIFGNIFGFKDVGLGIDELTATPGRVNVFPNPNTGEFTISLTNAHEKEVVIIYNTIGEKIYEGALNPNITQINLGTQPAGLYLYRVLTQEGQLIGSGKVIIQ